MASISLGTAALIGGLASAGGSIASSVIGGNAAKDASKQQVGAEQQALDFQKQIFAQQQANQAPFLQAGQQSIGDLMKAIQSGQFGAGSNAPVPQFTGQFHTPTLEEAQATPGYQFTAQQGSKGILEGAAAAGGAISGGTLKALDQYNTGLANQTYGDVFNRSLATYGTGLDAYKANLAGYQTGLQKQAQEYEQLYNPAALGEGSVQSLNNSGAQAAQNVGSLMGQIGNAQAAGTIGSANALSQGLGGVTGSLSSSLLLGSLLKGGGFGLGGGGGLVSPGGLGSLDTNIATSPDRIPG